MPFLFGKNGTFLAKLMCLTLVVTSFKAQLRLVFLVGSITGTPEQSRTVVVRRKTLQGL